ncbi:MAG: hypothetical protein ABFD98_10675 [Syntrophobacteraceae bacterium]|nr:hypothetical protein [Desulfobacteraceae bacterium]
MEPALSKLLFDQRDYDLLALVNNVLDNKESPDDLQKLSYPFLHSHGIKEMAATRGLRVAYAVIRLLDSLEAGQAVERIRALRSLHEETLYSATSGLRTNTARVLVQIMKELVRAQGDTLRQLELAHDFRAATFGKPRIIRSMLKRYYLLEMSEDWNQVSFDDHVHDANTKGRKTPTHLIMDAWIKGIRKLTVVYYNYVRPQAVAELLEAAEIAGITVRIGIELRARFRGRNVQLIWAPGGFSDAQDFLHLLATAPAASFMEEGRKVSEYSEKYVLALLEEYNRTHRPAINEAFGINVPPVSETDFLTFVRAGQPSVLHLASFIHTRILPAMQKRVEAMRSKFETAGPEAREDMSRLVETMDRLGPEEIVDWYLSPEANPSIPNPEVPADGPDVPDLLKLSPCALIDRLHKVHAGSRIILGLRGLGVEDVLELLSSCAGAITHLEIFNSRDYNSGRAIHYEAINKLQRALNDGNAIQLKRIILQCIQGLETSVLPDREDRIVALKGILKNIPGLQACYQGTPLKSCISTDSTGRSHRHHGMGLVIKDTLPQRTQKDIEKSNGRIGKSFPVHIDAHLQTTYIPRQTNNPVMRAVLRAARGLPGGRLLTCKCIEDWVVENESARIEPDGNVLTLGGVKEECTNGLSLQPRPVEQSSEKVPLTYLNMRVKNVLKIFIGFVPAFATFSLTKDWWLLAYFGAFIWFGITGLRNIVQSVLGGGGIRRSPLLRWNDYVSWDRISDSLLYTGFSVPLLDYIVKTVILDRMFGVTTATSPIVLYSFMGLANGIYISSHNTIRGLPKEAIFGNFFRSILSIPLAVIFNALIGGLLGAVGVPDVAGVLQKWAAVISKAASDCVAGIIEGFADRATNLRIRARDYADKLTQLFDTYARLELLLPEADVLEMLESPQRLMEAIGPEARDLEKVTIINALDLSYFWMYQPRARHVCRSLVRNMSDEERQILVRSQSILQREREISQMFVDGLVGGDFARALSFFLDCSKEYLDAIRKLASSELPKARDGGIRETMQAPHFHFGGKTRALHS